MDWKDIKNIIKEELKSRKTPLREKETGSSGGGDCGGDCYDGADPTGSDSCLDGCECI